MRSLVIAAIVAHVPSFAQAQLWSYVPPGPGTSVDFVACPELTAGGSWVATDSGSGVTYSLTGAPPPPPNTVIRVSGVVSPRLIAVPGWSLTPITIIAGRARCPSVGIPQPPRGSFFPWFETLSVPVIGLPAF